MTPRGRTAVAVVVGVVATTVVSVAVAGPAVALRPRDTVAEPVATADAIDPSPEACARCHGDVVDAWRGSMHAQAFADPIFRAELDPAPAASCLGCHDPAGGRTGTHGVDCATCHVRDGEVLATRVSAAGRRVHPMRVDPQLGSVERCGTCHQFDHEDDGIHDPTEPLQATLDEWRGSDAARDGLGCVDCHMPSRGRARGHDLPGLGAAALVGEAVTVRVRPHRTEAGLDVEVAIAGDVIGHAFPTGDIFRQAVLTVRTSDGAEQTRSLQRWEARTADPDGDDTHVRTVDDTRVPPPGKGYWQDSLSFPDATSDRVDWSLEIRRLQLSVADARGLPSATVVVPVQSGRAWSRP